MPEQSWGEKPCLCREGELRGFTRSTAKYYNFCGNCYDGFCKMWFVCHDDPSKHVELLRYYVAAIRLHFEWHYYQILAYSREQAITMLRQQVGFDKTLWSKDFQIRYMRTLTREQTLQNKRSRIREKMYV